MSRLLRYPVVLSAEQQQTLKGITTTGSRKARVMTRARILLMAHRGVTDSDIKEALGISVQMVQAARKRFALGGLDAAHRRAPHTGRPVKFDGKDRAAITALACSEAPEGHAQWSLRLLAQKAVELKLVDHIAPSTVLYMLKKTRSNRTAKGSGALRN
ncbi:helix-turn-helix domain-containing protein [Deinococcus cavernae]|uniref:Helix-turn-helix domain-containing protein n=1 Tax=Deinococcus cavernae TaxID=2320857 RepID=A0A418UZM1_9DEIO|nr:helix-turn-helix domain-containing protein [Deinococcus cavernae]RJF68912.1 helix-turn-helix domain-containing protein [Deinococcus cavernae]RJF71704.1 helix-turn-helix domain-containing protein [Deinococcus cavernae]